MKLKHKLLLIFFSITLIPIFLTALSASLIASNALEQQRFDQLTAVREGKKSQIQDYFTARRNDIELLSHTVQNVLDTTSFDTLNRSAHALNEYFAEYIKRYQYYDLFLIHPNGEVFYTVTREADYQSNLQTGPYSHSGLGRLFAKVNASGEYALEDFSRYAPSNDAPAAFIGYPFSMRNGETYVLALQLSIEKINEVMQSREGMGDTGESYLVGSDKLMRSDSFLDPKNHSVNASFGGNVRNNGVDTEAVSAALNGRTETQIILDYNGEEVLSAYTPIQVGETRWVLLSEINKSEAFGPVYDMYWVIACVLVLTILAVLVISIGTTISIIKPLGGEPEQMHEMTEQVANGDLTFKFDPTQNHHGIYGAMHRMVDSLQSLIGDIIHSSGILASTAEQTSASSLQAKASLMEQKKSIEMVATAVEEMSMSVTEVAQNALDVAGATQSAKTQSGQANLMLDETVNSMNKLGENINGASEVIRQLDNDSQSISSVMEVISGIAEQTNLLALNAAIEAARAGEQGRGFAVVADEVRQLAQKTQVSTQDIASLIQKLQSAAKEAVGVMEQSQQTAQTTIEKASATAEAINEVDRNIESISQMSSLIAQSAEEQSTVTQEISQSITRINDAAGENHQSAEEASKASEQISQLAVSLNNVSLKFKMV